MHWISVAVAVLALVIAALGVIMYAVIRGQAKALEARIAELAAELAAVADAPAAPPVPVGTARPIMTIEILNPIELASSQRRAASLIGSWRPEMITKIVYDEAAKQIAAQLAVEGVVAEVQVHAAG